MSAFDHRYWNLAQVAVWVIYREKVLVEQFAIPDRNSYIAIGKYPTMWPDGRSEKGPQQELWRALVDSRLNAQGYPRNNPERLVDIPPADWNNLIIDPPTAYLRGRGSIRLEPWVDFVIDSAEVKKLWRSEFETSGRTRFDWAAIRTIHDDVRANNPEMTKNELMNDIALAFAARFDREPPSRTSLQRNMKGWS